MLPQSDSGDVKPDTPPASDDNRRRRILLAEDDVEMRSLLVLTLQDAGYDVEALPDGLELMDQLAAYLAPGAPMNIDLIISDIRMPWVDGMEVLRNVRQYIGYPKMILITAFGDDSVHSEARRLGAAAVLDKPFDLDQLLAAVQDVLPNGRDAAT